MKSKQNAHVDVTLRLNRTHQIFFCCSSVKAIDGRQKFESSRGGLGIGKLTTMVLALQVDENDPDDDLDRRFRSRQIV